MSQISNLAPAHVYFVAPYWMVNRQTSHAGRQEAGALVPERSLKAYLVYVSLL